MPPDPAETERLRAVVHALPASGWTGSGHAQVAAPEGDFEGTLQAAVDAPRRARVELVARALFGMVGERVVLSLPGDGNVLYYRERGDQLERMPFSQSDLARWTGCDSPVQLFSLVEGRPPWPGGDPPGDLEGRTRVMERGESGRKVRYRVQLPESKDEFDLQLRDGELESLRWSHQGATRLEVRYDRWVWLETRRQPTRMRLSSPQEHVQAEFTLDRVQSKPDFSASDFEVY